MKRMISILLATAAFVGALGVADAAYDIDKVKVPRTGGEEKAAPSIHRKFKGIETYVNTYPMFTFYARYNAGQITAEERKAFDSWPKAAQDQFLIDSKWLAGTKWRTELYGRVGEKAWANKMAVAKGEEKPFEFIEKAYGKDAYAWIVDNRKTLDAKFSTYIEGERDKLKAGTMKADHSNSEIARIPTYEAYVNTVGVVKLEAMKAPGSTVRRKAMAEYFEYLLITDGRLYFK